MFDNLPFLKVIYTLIGLRDKSNKSFKTNNQLTNVPPFHLVSTQLLLQFLAFNINKNHSAPFNIFLSSNLTDKKNGEINIGLP